MERLLPNGDWWVWCDVCSSKTPRSNLLKQWDGAYTCPKCYDNRPRYLEKPNIHPTSSMDVVRTVKVQDANQSAFSITDYLGDTTEYICGSVKRWTIDMNLICPPLPFAVAAGTADAMTATFTSLTLTDGLDLQIRAVGANTLTNPTLDVGTGAITITKFGGSALAVGDIKAAGHEIIVRYRATPTRFELVTPAPSSSSSPIGTIVEAPTAPTDGWTWLECNGQAVSQTTYSALYSILGHSWAQFKVDGVGDLGSTNTNSTGRFFYTGPGSYVYFNGSTQGFSSGDGITWTGLPASPVNPAAGFSLVVRGSVWLLFNTAGTTLGARTANGGTTWANQTWPASLQQIIDNGTNFVGYTGSGTNVYSSADGVTWSTHAGVLPFSFGNGVLFWDGTAWIIAEQTSDNSNSFNIYKTTVSNAASGWTLVAAPSVKYGAITSSKSNGEVLSISGKNCLVSTGQFTTNTVSFSPNAPHPNSVVWNGYVYVGTAEVDVWETFAANANYATGGRLLVSTDGRQWNPVKFPVLTGNISGVTPMTGLREAKNLTSCADTSTGNIMTGLSSRTSSLAENSMNVRWSTLLKFNFTVGTQFCVPELHGTIAKWIRAL